MIIPGIVASSSGGGSYHADAVHYDPGASFGTWADGAILSTGNFTSGLFSIWIANVAVGSPDVLVYVSDDINAGFNINQNNASDFAVISYDDPGGARTLQALNGTFLLPITSWTHVIVSAYQPTQTLQCYVNGSPIDFGTPTWGPGGGFGNSTGDTWSILGTGVPIDAADMYFRLSNDAFFDLSVPSNLAKFIAAGKPVNPSGFPSGGMTLTGNAAAWIATATGLGLTLTNTLTNASTSPSD